MSQTYLLTNDIRDKESTHDSILIGSILTKIFQRGQVPYCTLGIEDEIRNKFKLRELLDQDGIEIKNQISRDGIYSAVLDEITKRRDFELDADFEFIEGGSNNLFDSPREEHFLTTFLSKEYSKTISHWLIPQANIPLVMKSNDKDTNRDGRLDFLLAHPLMSEPINIELDGDHHFQEKSDGQRDDELKQCGIRVIRIKNSELERGDGKNLRKLKESIQQINKLKKQMHQAGKDEEKIAQALIETTYLTKLQFAIIRAIKNGWTNKKNLTIKVSGLSDIAAIAIRDIFLLSRSLDQIYGTNTSPEFLGIITDQSVFITDENFEVLQSDKEFTEIDLRISMEKDVGITHQVLGEASKDVNDFIIRPAHININFSYTDVYLGERRKVATQNIETLKEPMTQFLRYLFRKEEFREGQLEAIVNGLNHKDSIILLATGAGKSIIFQLTGLMMPGVTFVISPLVALMDDQVDGLHNFGIDRAQSINSTLSMSDSNKTLNQLADNQLLFLYVAPERLQNDTFRDRLADLNPKNLINLVAIDEAHCVSEWGHDFRPAYLNISEKLKKVFKSPPILALTGTASNSVLTDLMTEVDIDPSDENATIRPKSLNRKELNFFIMKTTPSRWENNKTDVLRDILIKKLPHNLAMDSANELFNQRGRKTSSGIIFTQKIIQQRMISESFEEKKEYEEIKKVTGQNELALHYHANLSTKKINAEQFKRNLTPLLISTKAYGMGIDKPNVRYTVHFGLPGSIESFYQEAGRAGRDRETSFCGLIYCQSKEKNAENLLDRQKKIADLRKENSKIAMNDRGDLENQLYFHLTSWGSIAEERGWVDKILFEVEDKTVSQTIEVPIEFFTPLDPETGKEKVDKKTGKKLRESDERHKERAITRLQRLGFISDYTKQGKKSFRILTQPFDLEKSKDRFLDYVSKVKIDQVNSIRKSLDDYDWESQEESKHIGLISWFLIKFIYDSIEMQRRNALFEMIELAENAETHSQIRDRILDFLEEGEYSEIIQELLSQPKIDLLKWFELIDNIENKNISIYGQLRGNAARAISDGRDNPGVRLLRSLSELHNKDCNEETAYQELKASISESLSDNKKYEFVHSDYWQRVIFRYPNIINESLYPNIGKTISYTHYESIKEGIIGGELKQYTKDIFEKIDDDGVKTVRKTFDFVEITDSFDSLSKNIISELETYNLDRF